ncbi:MAG: hypothetical protein K2H32_08090 [Muribaculaceae bacterium]|nr:hypothetical protein [Muribaculaceae bacterium]MDE7368957.1 hypothetical protein [Muribaculaceae bacterium]
MLFSQKEMLEQWRLRHCLDASGITGNADDRFDRRDSDLIDLAQMNDWYAELLARGDKSLVQATDITSRLTLNSGEISGEWTARLPDDVIAVVAMELNEAGNVEIIDPTSRLAGLLNGEFAPIPSQKPIAFAKDGVLKVFIDIGSLVSLSRVMAVTAPPDGFYSITQKGLALIPKPDLYL